MPYTFNGFGTKYYGRREPGEDGSYLTTLWITALYIPVLPLGSYRVLPVGQGTNYIIHRSQNYQVLPVPLCWEQVWHVYMFGAPILILVGWLIWSSEKDDRLKESFRAQVNARGDDVVNARLEADKLQDGCVGWFDAQASAHKGVRSLHDELHERCAPWIAAVDTEAAKLDRMVELMQQGASAGFLAENERARMKTGLAVWSIRRHEADETRQIATCLANIEKNCFEAMFPVQAAMKDENKKACSLLASIDEKCEQ